MSCHSYGKNGQVKITFIPWTADIGEKRRESNILLDEIDLIGVELGLIGVEWGRIEGNDALTLIKEI